MASFDRIMLDLMAKWNLPGGAIGVVKDGRLIFVRGYGFADKEKGEAVQPNSLFRIASVTKPFTAVAILKLVEDGKLNLDAKVLPLLDHLTPQPGTTPDSRLNDITIRQLLQHSGGWDLNKSFDPMFYPGRAAQALGVPSPGDAATIVRYMKGQPLQFDPGTQYVYSNLGYNILGRIIEKVSGQSYGDFVTDRILKPAGITQMRLARSRIEDRAPGEVRYYDYPGAPLEQSVFPDGGTVPGPYGGYYIEAMDAHGGWIASPIDVLRFANAVDGRNRQPSILQSATINQMIARPAGQYAQGKASFYALGWQVRPSGSDANWWHTGSLRGTTSIVVRAANGLTWFAVFNSRSKDFDALNTDVDNALWRAVNEVKEWPSHNLFGQFQ
jgi:CubicO group peptidase (beta-lactamase class C family)